jgi:hypothetical protein
MDSNQVAFIEGFVKQCAARGWTEDQTSRALALVQLNEQLQDPDYAAGFAKQALDLKQILGVAGRWATDTSKPMNQAIVGAGLGGLGGLLFGGKKRIRNALLGAGGGALAGYGVGRGLQYRNERNQARTAQATKEIEGIKQDGENAARRAGMSATFSGPSIKAPGMDTPEEVPETNNASFGTTSTARLGTPNIGYLRQVAADTSRPYAERVAARQRLNELQGANQEGPGVARLLGAGAAEGLHGVTVAPAEAVGKALSGAGEAIGGGAYSGAAKISDAVGESWQGWNDARAAEKQKELEQILSTGVAKNSLGVSVNASERAQELAEALENYKRKSIQSGRKPGVDIR